MVEFGVVERAACIAMGIDMDHADGALSADRLQDRMADRMVAADRKRGDAGCDDLRDARSISSWLISSP